MPSPLENLAGPGKALMPEPPDAREFAGLLRAGLARLKDAENAHVQGHRRDDLGVGAAGPGAAGGRPPRPQWHPERRLTDGIPG